MFMAGVAFPSFLLPCLLLIAWMVGRGDLFCIPFLHFIPLIWGIWNILYFVFFKKILPKNSTHRLLITGAVLGLLIAVYAVFVLNLPEAMGLPQSMIYLPLIIGPILYALCWLYIVNPLNRAVL